MDYAAIHSYAENIRQDANALKRVGDSMSEQQVDTVLSDMRADAEAIIAVIDSRRSSERAVAHAALMSVSPF